MHLARTLDQNNIRKTFLFWSLQRITKYTSKSTKVNIVEKFVIKY